MDGANIALHINNDGTLTYTATLPNGDTITAATEAGLRNGLAAAAEMKVLSGDISNGETKNASFTYKAGSVSVTVDSTG
jgi:hypothetical protein